MSDKNDRRKIDRRISDQPYGGPERRVRVDRRAVVAPLDRRVLMSVSTDADGWTVVAPADDTRVIYVSSSAGSDANSGRSAGAAVKTVAKGQSLIRDGSADWLLLKRGDTFEAIGDWKKRGRSDDEPILISAYGSGLRPKIYSGTGVGFTTLRRDGRSIDNLVISSLDFWAHTYNHTNGNGATAGIRLTSPGTNILIEDVRVTGYKDNVVFDAVGGTLADVTIRRSVILDAHAGAGVGNGYAQGIYIGAATNRVTIEENLIDHNGWRQGKSSDRTYYSHNIYAKGGAAGVMIRNNVISRAGFYGVKLNSGGTVRGNVFIRNSEAVYLEAGATIEDNVITESVDHPNQNWGVGINTQKAASAIIRRNLITNSLSNSAGPKAAIQLFDNNGSFRGTVENNIVYDWQTGLWVDTPGSGAGSVVIRNNQFQVRSGATAADHRSDSPIGNFKYANNVYSAGAESGANRFETVRKSLSAWSDAVNESAAKYQSIDYPDPDRDTADYAANVGSGSSFDSFIAAARGTNRDGLVSTFSAGEIGAWYRAGFFGVSSAADPGPGIRSFSFDDSSAPRAVFVRFTQNVRPSLSKNDLRVINIATGERVEIQSMTWSAEHKRARFNIRTANLPAGQYRAYIDAGAVENTAGAALPARRKFGFSVTEIAPRSTPFAATTPVTFSEKIDRERIWDGIL